MWTERSSTLNNKASSIAGYVAASGQPCAITLGPSQRPYVVLVPVEQWHEEDTWVEHSTALNRGVSAIARKVSILGTPCRFTYGRARHPYVVMIPAEQWTVDTQDRELEVAA